MSLSQDATAIGGFDSHSSRGCGPYEAFIASAASSSQTTIFSDQSSEQSSVASSISDDFRQNHDEVRDRVCAQAQLHHQLSQGLSKVVADRAQVQQFSQGVCPTLSYADVTSAAPEQRQHPRRSSLARNQKPPSLQRQQDRKTHFVDSLVDSASQMVEVIWPLSVVPCRGDGASGRGVLPLRTYIEETLRRSRTSYSTLQVALYYLVLIRPFVPTNDFTQEQRVDCPASRALMCGRRMFLAALILASKYLQDRNYSAKAWSKMSGLSVTEINTNERTFLAKVDFKLHIPDAIFTRWTEIVLKYTPNTQPPSPGQGCSTLTSWKSIIPVLTPALDTIPLPESSAKPRPALATKLVASYGCLSPATPTPTHDNHHPPTSHSTSNENTPTPATVQQPPRFLEPRPELPPPTPALARLGPLPTPQLTPSSVAASTPAASACSSRRPSMCSAMAFAQRASFVRCAVDAYPFTSNCREGSSLSRRPSIVSASSSRSSPESMISDRSRSSRASSISSVSTLPSLASLAPLRADLVRPATCRKVRMPMLPAPVAEEREGGSIAKPIVISDEAEMVCSPEMSDFSIGEKKLHAPHKHTKFASHPSQASSAASATGDKGRKRCRSHGTRRSHLHEEVRLMLEEELDFEDIMDVDDGIVDDASSDHIVDLTSPSPAVKYATRLLSSSTTTRGVKCVQPPASLSLHGPCRLPVPRHEGKKRSCCSTAMSVSPAPGMLYGEVL